MRWGIKIFLERLTQLEIFEIWKPYLTIQILIMYFLSFFALVRKYIWYFLTKQFMFNDKPRYSCNTAPIYYIALQLLQRKYYVLLSNRTKLTSVDICIYATWWNPVHTLMSLTNWKFNIWKLRNWNITLRWWMIQ